MSFIFENLKIWDRSLDLNDHVQIIATKFPRNEEYVLSSQIRRACDSISLNIAEGSTGQSNREFNRFLGIALRSNIEVVGCIYLAKRRSIISSEDFNKGYSLCLELSKMIQAFRKTLNDKKQ